MDGRDQVEAERVRKHDVKQNDVGIQQLSKLDAAATRIRLTDDSELLELQQLTRLLAKTLVVIDDHNTQTHSPSLARVDEARIRASTHRQRVAARMFKGKYQSNISYARFNQDPDQEPEGFTLEPESNANPPGRVLST
jgi:hypothetical protein